MTGETHMAQRGAPVSRRQITTALAWTAPVVLTLTTAPASAASTPPPTKPAPYYDVQVASITHHPDHPESTMQSSRGAIPLYTMTSKGGPRTLRFSTVLRNVGTLPVPVGALVTLSLSATARKKWGRRAKEHHRFAEYPVLTSVSDGFVLSVSGNPYEVTHPGSVPEISRRQDYRLEVPMQPGQAIEVNWTADVKYAISGYRIVSSVGSQFRLPPDARPVRNIQDDFLVEEEIIATKHTLR